jgi:transposase
LIRRIVFGVVAALFATAIGLDLGVTTAHANKVDCAKVMTEVAAGKKTKDIAKEMSISTSSVYRCKSKAKTKSTGPKTAAISSPVAAASPKAAKSK